MAKHYKPDREVYLMAADYLSCRPEQLMMVAAHKGDLQAARKAGLKTAYVPRPAENGPGGKAEPPDADFDVVAKDFVALAVGLGA
jgi:2-haloacid dehalogenase